MLENEEGSEFEWDHQSEDNTEPETIAIVDDDESILDMLSFKFKDDYHVKTLENGEDCLSLLSETSPEDAPSIVVLDVMMPGRNGIEILKDIRSLDNHSNIPVIVLSGTATDETATQAINAGADDYIDKPVSLDELEARVRRILNEE